MNKKEKQLTTLARIARILQNYSDLTEKEIMPDTEFDGHGMDSLDCVEVLMDVENEFDVEIFDEDAEKFRTCGDLVHYLEERMQ